MLSAQLFTERRRRLMQKLPDRSIAVVPPSEACHASADANHEYAPSRNLYYLTGITQENTWLVMYDAGGGKLQETLFVDPFDPEYEKWWGRKLTTAEASEVSGITEVRTDRGWIAAIERIISRSTVSGVHVDFPLLGMSRARDPRHSFAIDLRDSWPGVEHGRLSPRVHEMRMVKDEADIAMILGAIRTTDRAFRDVLAMLRPGVREYEVEAVIASAMISAGGKPAFPTIAAGGGRATCLHYTDNDAVLEDGEMLLLDFGCSNRLYSSDITRTIPVGGRYSPRQRELMELVLEIQRRAIGMLKPGRTHAEWNAEVCEVYAGMLAGAGTIPDPSALEQVYYHRTGHHLGLDTHDEATVETVIAPGMVFTVEPGLYLAGESTGIRIEDDVLVGENGCTVLSGDIPRSPDEIEMLMKRS